MSIKSNVDYIFTLLKTNKIFGDNVLQLIFYKKLSYKDMKLGK